MSRPASRRAGATAFVGLGRVLRRSRRTVRQREAERATTPRTPERASLLPEHRADEAFERIERAVHPLVEADVTPLTMGGDGSVTLLTGAAELGQGSATVLGQIVAEELGTTLDRVRVVQSNTLVTPYARSTGAGRTTSLEGLTVLQACREAKAQLRDMAADVWEASADDIAIEPSGVAIDGRFMGWGEVIGTYFGMADMEIIGRGQIRREGDLAEAPAWWELAIAGVEVDVDRETGEWRLTKLVTVADVGLAINPALLDGGDLGARLRDARADRIRRVHTGRVAARDCEDAASDEREERDRGEHHHEDRQRG